MTARTAVSATILVFLVAITVTTAIAASFVAMRQCFNAGTILVGSGPRCKNASDKVQRFAGERMVEVHFNLIIGYFHYGTLYFVSIAGHHR